MILPYTVTIQSKSTTYDDEGMPVTTWSDVATIQADIQPVGGEIVQREYGITETGITRRMFYEVNAEVQNGRRVVHGSSTYEIRYVAEWRNHYEVLLKPVIS